MSQFLAPVVALTLIVAPPTTPTPSRDRPTMAELIALYSPLSIRAQLNNPNIKAELKVTKEQDVAVQAILKKEMEKYPYRVRLELKGTEKEKAAKNRAMDVAEAEEYFQVLAPTLSAEQVTRLKQLLAQFHGSLIFELPEVRAALKMSDQQAAGVKALYKKLRDEIAKEAGAGKIDAATAEKKIFAFSRGVPAQVRATLTEEQQKALNDLLGGSYDWSK